MVIYIHKEIYDESLRLDTPVVFFLWHRNKYIISESKCKHLPYLSLVQTPAMDLVMPQEWNKLGKVKLETCSCKQLSGSFVVIMTPSGKSSPFTLRCCPSMEWTPNHADSIPVYALGFNKLNNKYSVKINFLTDLMVSCMKPDDMISN